MGHLDLAELLPRVIGAELLLLAATLLAIAAVELWVGWQRLRARVAEARFAEPLTELLMGDAVHLPPVPRWLRTPFTRLWVRLANHVRGESSERLRAYLLAHGAERDVLRLLRARSAGDRVLGCDAARLLKPPSAMPELRRLVRDREEVVDLAAWRALIEIDPLTAFPALAAELVGSESWTVAQHSALFREGAAIGAKAFASAALAAPPGAAAALLRVLAEGDDPGALDVLVTRYRAGASDAERAWCLFGIGRFGGARERSLVIAALADPDERVRWQAVAALGRIGVTPDWERLEQALGDRSYWVRQAAAEALLVLPGVPRERLQALAASHPDPHGRDALAAALARVAP